MVTIPCPCDHGEKVLWSSHPEKLHIVVRVITHLENLASQGIEKWSEKTEIVIAIANT